MRAAVVLGVLTTALALAGCGGDDPDPRPPETTATSGAAQAPFGNDPDTRAALGVVEAYYAGVAQHDCITLRTMSTLEEQAEDDAWADCIDVLLERAGDGFAYEVASGAVDGDTAAFQVDVTQAAGVRTDTITLLRSGDAWLVDDSLVTAAG